MSSWSTRPLAPSEAAILRHPDRRSAWAPGLIVSVRAPGLDHAVAAVRLAELVDRHPILSACLNGETWIAGAARPAIGSLDDRDAFLRHGFDLATESPLRVALSADGRTLGLVSHHAALDGRALVSIAAALLGGAMPEPFDPAAAPRGDLAPVRPSALVGGAGAVPDGARAAREMKDAAVAAVQSGPGEALRRLARPADRVAPSAAPSAREVFADAVVPAGARMRVAPLAAAAVAAAGAWNVTRGAPWRRVGLTIPVGGPLLLGNVATHRRVDVPAEADIAAAVTAALAASAEPPGAGQSAFVLRLLAPVVNRLSDSLLVSNLGVVTITNAEAVDFYPQARGRSAVAIGAGTVDGGARKLTLRARDLNATDAQTLLDQIVARLA